MPALFTTYSCVYWGTYCQFAVFGPDAQNVVDANRQALIQRTARDGSSSQVNLRVEVVKGWWSSRVDVYAMQSGEDSIIDSFYTQSPQIVAGSNRNEFAVAARWGDRSEIYVLRWRTEYQRRVFKLECSYGDVTINNLTISSAGNELIFDIESSCAFLTVNARHTIGVGSSIWAEGRHGDRVRIELDDELLLRSIQAVDYDAGLKERISEEQKSREAAVSELRKCADMKADDIKGAKDKGVIKICVAREYASANSGPNYDSTWEYIILALKDGAYTTNLSGECKGKDFDYSMSMDGKSAVLLCFEDKTKTKTYVENDIIWRKTVGESVAVKLTGVSEQKASPIFDIKMVCRCGAIDVRDIVFDAVARTIDFDLKANAPSIELDGVVHPLDPGVAVADEPIGRSEEAHLHGRYRLMFNERYGGPTLRKISALESSTAR